MAEPRPETAGLAHFDSLTFGSCTLENDDDSVVAPPTDKEQCKKGGWKNFDNPSFKNQGQCVSFVASGGKARPNQ